MDSSAKAGKNAPVVVFSTLKNYQQGGENSPRLSPCTRHVMLEMAVIPRRVEKCFSGNLPGNFY